MYKIKKAEPFVIEGENGKYMIPAWNNLSVEEGGELLSLKPDTPAAERIKILKSFILKMCPGIEKENLNDFGYSQIFAAYEKEQKLGEK